MACPSIQHGWKASSDFYGGVVRSAFNKPPGSLPPIPRTGTLMTWEVEWKSLERSANRNWITPW